MKVDWVFLAIGCAIVALSVTIWRHRDQLAKMTADGQQAMFGDRSKVFQRAATGKNMAYPAIGGCVMGLAVMASSMFSGGHS